MQQKRVTGAKECTWTSFGSLSPPKCHIFRQKSAKINFGMSLLHKIIGVTESYKTLRAPIHTLSVSGYVNIALMPPVFSQGVRNEGEPRAQG